jgi:hypothetical protein
MLSITGRNPTFRKSRHQDQCCSDTILLRFAARILERMVHKLNRLVLIVCLTTAVVAQGQGRFNIFGGFSYTNYAPTLPAPGIPITPPPPLIRSLKGWNASLEGRVLPFVGIVADFGGHYGQETVGLLCPLLIVTFCAPDNENVRLYTFLLGPQVSFSISRFTPFAHALVGGAHVAVGTRQSFLLSSGVFSPPNTDTGFADALGGGLDYRLIGPIRLRIQADALQTRLRNPFASTSKITQTNLRLSTGVVFHF